MYAVTDRLGVVVKTARTDKRLTQKQLASRLSISSDHLKSIENKKRTPSCDLLFSLIRELDIPADTIFYPEYNYDSLIVGRIRLLMIQCGDKNIHVAIEILQSLLDNTPEEVT